MTNIFTDIRAMHDKFGVTAWVEKHKDNPEMLNAFLKFRIQSMMAEEWNELNTAYDEKDSEELVDGIIDLIVFGTTILDALGVDGELAWKRVYDANMAKNPGVKEGRPNPLGLPDMIKNSDWVAPTHKDNVGLLKDIFD